MTFGTAKLEWCGWLPIVKKTEDIFTHFDRIHERDADRQTDGQMDEWTPRDGIGRAEKRLKILRPNLACQGSYYLATSTSPFILKVKGQGQKVRNLYTRLE